MALPVKVPSQEESICVNVIQILRNGRPIPDSGSHPESRVAVAYGLIFFISGASALLGAIAEFFRIQFLLNMGLGLGAILFGTIFAFLGFLVKRGSVVALVIAIVLFAADGLFSVLAAIAQGGRVPTGGLVVRIFLLIPMIRAIPAIRTMKKEETQPTVG